MELSGEDFITKNGKYSEFFERGDRLLSIALSTRKSVVEGATPGRTAIRCAHSYCGTFREIGEDVPQYSLAV